MKAGLYAKLKWLRRPEMQPEAPATPDISPGWLTPEPAERLLGTPARERLLQTLWQRTSLTRPLFNELYLQPITRFALLVQQLPASENHHHAYPGGLLDHTLDVMTIAARMRQSHLLPAGAAPEDQAKEAEAWTAATLYGALLHDIGKTATDMEIVTSDNRRWYPWETPLTQPYRLRFTSSRDYHLHPTAGALLCLHILPASALSWLAQFPGLFSAFLYCISGHYDKAGVIGELVQNADIASVAQNMGGNAGQALARPKTSLAGQLTTAVRELVSTQLTLNNPKSGSDGWLTHEALWLVSKTAADKIRAWLLQQGVSGIPDSNSKLFDEMQSYGLIVPSPENKAIWHCDITASDGWTPGRPLTLLRFTPELVWPEVAKRPPCFEGAVTPVSESAVQEPVGKKPPVATPETAKTADSLDDLTLSLFAPDMEQPATASALKESLPALAEKPVTISVQTPAAAVKKSSQTEASGGNSTDIANTPLSATHFVHWLRQGVADKTLEVNDTKARIHMVDGAALLVSPEIFKLYIKTTTGQTGSEWRQLQRAFQRLQLHRRGEDGINIWNIQIQGPRRTRNVKGYLLDNPQEIFGNTVPEDNPYLSVLTRQTCTFNQ